MTLSCGNRFIFGKLFIYKDSREDVLFYRFVPVQLRNLSFKTGLNNTKFCFTR